MSHWLNRTARTRMLQWSRIANMQRVGRYEILGELGRGAMGVVLRAMDPVIGRTIAIKTIRFEGVDDPEDQQRLRDRLFREARSAGMLSHPHIVTIYDIGQDGDLAYIAMEYVAGATLDVLMRDKEKLDRQAVTNVLAETAAALDYAHARGIVHRDIKPGNVMLTDNGSVKVTDFGVAKITSHQMTKTDMVLGTPSYMSPEQIEGSRGVDGRADQFSLSVLAYEMLSGEKPFTGDSLPSLLFKIAREQAPPIQMVNATLDENVDAVFRRAMAKQSADRYATCTDFINALNEALIGCPNWSPLARGVATEMPTLGPTMTEATPIRGTGAGTGAPLLAATGPGTETGRGFAPPQTTSGTAQRGGFAAPAGTASDTGMGSGSTGVPGGMTGTVEPFRASRRVMEDAEPAGSSIGKSAAIGAGVALVLIAGGLAAAHFLGVYPIGNLAQSLGIGLAAEGPADPAAADSSPSTPGTAPPVTAPPADPAKPTASQPVEPAPAAPVPPGTATGSGEAPSSTGGTSAAATSTAPGFRTSPGTAEPLSAMVEMVSTPPGARVRIDDTQEGCVTPCSMELPAGRHVIRYTLEGHRPGVSVVLVPQEAKASTRLDPASGTLLLISTPPGARVFVDGEPKGTTPASIKTSIGRHKVELKLPGLPDHSRELDVQDQQIVNIEVTWPGAQ
ncbi:MAG: protein kinase [Bryobacteraceae bacterium]